MRTSHTAHFLAMGSTLCGRKASLADPVADEKAARCGLCKRKAAAIAGGLKRLSTPEAQEALDGM